MNTSFLGDIAELKCLISFVELGYQVSIPYGNHARYDFIVEIENKLYKIQVKKAKENFTSEGSFSIEGRTSTRSGHQYYKENEIDFFATYFNNKCYLIPVKECYNLKTLRYKEAKINSKNISWAKDYELEKIIEKIII